MISRYPHGLDCNCDCGSLRSLPGLSPSGLSYDDAGDWAQVALRFTNDWLTGNVSPASVTATMDILGIEPDVQPAVRSLVNSAFTLATQLGWSDAELQAEIRRVLSTSPAVTQKPPASSDNTMLYVGLAVLAVLLLKK